MFNIFTYPQWQITQGKHGCIEALAVKAQSINLVNFEVHRNSASDLMNAISTQLHAIVDRAKQVINCIVRWKYSPSRIYTGLATEYVAYKLFYLQLLSNINEQTCELTEISLKT